MADNVVRGTGRSFAVGPYLALLPFLGFLVSFVTAYVARHTLTYGASFQDVFRLTGTIAVASYTMAVIPESIWMWRPWSATIKSVCDSIAYGVMTGLIFAWLWPHG